MFAHAQVVRLLMSRYTLKWMQKKTLDGLFSVKGTYGMDTYESLHGCEHFQF